MLAQLLMSFYNALTARAVNAIHGWNHAKFYFIATLIFLFSIGFVYREVVTTTINDVVFNQIKFRDCRDILGMQKEFDSISKRNPIIYSYAVFLYQPINNAFYKKVVLTNSENIMRSPALQGQYLKDQPTINKELAEHDYYIIDKKEALTHDDLRFLLDISDDTRLVYGLKINSKVVGEIGIRFKHAPSTLELEDVMKDLSPLLYNYIL